MRLHDLRHTWASVATMNGVDMVNIAKLLGHRRQETTTGFFHIADRHLVEAEERIGEIIAEAMDA